MVRNQLLRVAIKIKKWAPDFRGKHKLSKTIETVLGDNIIQKSPEGISLITRLSSQMDTSFLEEGGHSLIREEIHKLKPGENFLDIGANIGYFSLLAAKQIWPTGIAIAIEPSPREFEILLKNINANDYCQNIAPINCAASDQTAFCNLSLENHTGTNKIQASLDNKARTTLSIGLPLSKVIPDSLQSISLAKIDVEGYEFFGLKGLLPILQDGKISRIVLEFSPHLLSEHKHTVDDIYQLLKKCNYISTTKAIHGNGQWDEAFQYHPG